MMCACCGGDCKLIYQREEQESKKPYKSDFNRLLIDHLHNVGSAKQQIGELLNDDFLQRTSKHEKFWQSYCEDDADKLEDIRQKIAEIVDELHEIMETLTVGTFSEQ